MSYNSPKVFRRKSAFPFLVLRTPYSEQDGPAAYMIRSKRMNRMRKEHRDGKKYVFR